ncbi:MULTISPECIES: NAD(P)-dependent alcohol dehydrogenase [unclassified Chelatococcus]|uniref:NAD(P)-dependent alcohol dehydrogenase n=1 Tax=unclassified Chelatococcus TaxID=2638111 RepID=UPI001BCAA93B|nr:MULTISPECIES: NAD(P)-dependent alcohol dehydrogenase [unclassified Chelatococcus]CAH1661076.1 aldehyde reductase, NADPH-dependent [Hyphomicrobiales bacterium]MBS7741209.1 NAD(P)-dependent alcohol dehydrogenase [Chelatococcus sp. HY11]MBX3545395.1 NAD(P)-dependent alcohol dehydrogenase [Chelatococcus sp.]MCO5078031.1 NAD(P)-dependent alcohol dehydrogenase [Chelatococcus sp.]CAH1683210.1 aldehyde reductase, NADPH-dependent [Hyphomicrobiales bacterium]
MFTCTGYAAEAADQKLAPFTFQRRDPGPNDVVIEILYCGVCHSYLHTVRNEWQNTLFPSLPGHEIVGRVQAVGTDVTRFKAGDIAAVGCMVDSCRTCPSCREGLEQYCEPGFTGTYNSPDKVLGGPTFGGYSSHIVVDDAFVLKVPANLDLAAAAPLLCAGITTYSPLRHWKAGPGKKVGIVGLGGLGHMGVKLAHAMGAEVVLFTTSASKVDDGLRLGADAVVLSTDPAAMAAHAESFDLIVDAVAAPHDINAYLALIKRDGTLVQVGAPDKPLPVSVFSVIWRRRNFAGSLIGGIAETQEMLDFCGEHGITADIEMISMDKIEDAYARMLKSDVKYRFVIDMATLPKAA